MIDSHVHFWQYHPVKDAWITEDMPVIRRDFLPEDLIVLFDQLGIEGCIAVQADQSEAETHFLLNLADHFPVIKGVVGWIDLRDEGLDGRLESYRSFEQLKGWRHIVQAEPDGFLSDTAFRRGVQTISDLGYTYDLLIYPHQMDEAIAFVKQFPGLAIVIDHAAKPCILKGERTEWERKIKVLAQHQNVHCKLSGLITEADWLNWKEEEIIPYLEVLLACFGPKRLLFGSDWPVMLLAGTYERWFKLVNSFLDKLSLEEREAILKDNARRFYKLS